MELNPITITLDASIPRDISDALGLACRYLELDRSKVESYCVTARTARVDHMVLIRFCERHYCKFFMDFQTQELKLTFTPVTLDIATAEDIEEEEAILRRMKAKEDMKVLKKRDMALKEKRVVENHKKTKVTLPPLPGEVKKEELDDDDEEFDEL